MPAPSAPPRSPAHQILHRATLPYPAPASMRALHPELNPQEIPPYLKLRPSPSGRFQFTRSPRSDPLHSSPESSRVPRSTAPPKLKDSTPHTPAHTALPTTSLY